MENTPNQISAGAGGALSLYGQYQSMLNQGRYNINPNAPSPTFDAYGDPQYNLGNLTQQTMIRPQGAQGSEILNAGATGAIAGSAILPGLGTLIGGGIGALGAIFTGGARKRDMEKRRRLAFANLALAQKTYGVNKEQYLDQQLGMGDYNNKNNSYDRLTNLYMAQSGQTEL